MTLFECDNYILAIKVFLTKKAGLKSKLSQFIGVQASYLSKVLKNQADLNHDQILLVAQFFSLDELETDYLWHLLLANRAGRVGTRNYYNEKLKNIKKKAHELEKKLKTKSNLQEDLESEYYSSWIHSAVHITLLIKKMGPNEIAKTLGLQEQEILNSLRLLEKTGFIKKQQDTWQVITTTTHLSKSSRWLARHHINWRIKTIEKISRDNMNGLHYTSIACCSRKDKERIDQLLLDTLTKVREIIKNSSDEISFFYGLDSYDLTN